MACDLRQFLDDCEEVVAPKANSVQQRNIYERLGALGFQVTRPREDLKRAVSSRLKESMGCLTEAVEWMHSNGIQHRELKPAHILIRPYQILITGFTAASESDALTTERVGLTPGYTAPEVFNQRAAYTPSKADVYSLGCIFLHTLDVIYSPNQPQFQEPQDRNQIRHDRFGYYLESLPRIENGMPAINLPPHSFLPDKYVRLLTDMLEVDPSLRPGINEVNNKLWKLRSRANGCTALAAAGRLSILVR